MAAQKTRIQRLIEAIKSKRWHDANVLTSGILESKVMTRLHEEKKEVFKECPLDGDGKSPMDDMKKEGFNRKQGDNKKGKGGFKFKEDADKDADEPGGKEADEPISEDAAGRKDAASRLRNMRGTIRKSGDSPRHFNKGYTNAVKKNRPDFLKK